MLSFFPRIKYGGRVSSVKVNTFQRFTVKDCITRIRERDPVLHALIFPTLEQAEKQAQERAKETPRSELHGVPYTLKDVWDTAGIRTTGGSYRHVNRVPRESGRVNKALEEAGAILLGKSNLSDLALSAESDNYIVGAARNPHDSTRTSGGSTGGGAAAVADGMAAFDWGSDFGGSIRLPAAFCGIVGFRLSHSMWDPEGHFPHIPDFFKTFAGMGPITQTLEDCRTLLRALAPRLRTGGTAPFTVKGAMVYAPDRPSQGQWQRFNDEVTPKLRGLVPEVKHDHGLPSPSAVEITWNLYIASHFAKFLEGDELPLSQGLPAVLSSISFGRWRGDKRVHPSTGIVLFLLALGMIFFGWRKRVYADRVERIRTRVKELWSAGYVILSPTTTYPAPRHGRTLWTPNIMAFAKLGNLTDATGLAVPYGKFPDGMPRSLQFLGPPGSEEVLLDLAGKVINS